MPSFDRLARLFGWLLPPACREHVLGDLHERCNSRRQYAIEAISVLGPVVISRIRRTTDFQVLLMEALALYLSFVSAARHLGEIAFLYEHSGFARLAIPSTVTIAALLICNAYSNPEKQSVMRPVLHSGASISLGFLGQAAVFDTWRSLAVPLPIMLEGSCLAFVLISGLRLLFPAIHGHARPASSIRFGRPQQADLVPAKIFFQRAVRSVGSTESPTRKTVGSLAALLIVVLFGLSFWQQAAFKPRFAILAIVAVLAMDQIRTRK